MDVKKLATLANLPLTHQEEEKFSPQFEQTFTVIDEIRGLDTTPIMESYQVSGLKNITRTDEIDKSRIFTQEESTSQAPKRHNGYFVVPQILDAE